VVAFEDLHWADASTLELLTHVLRQFEPIPVMVLASFRPPPPDAAALLSFIEAARTLPCSERIDLGPIPSAAAE
jgi:predicted ATPase